MSFDIALTLQRTWNDEIADGAAEIVMRLGVTPIAEAMVDKDRLVFGDIKLSRDSRILKVVDFFDTELEMLRQLALIPESDEYERLMQQFERDLISAGVWQDELPDIVTPLAGGFETRKAA